MSLGILVLGLLLIRLLSLIYGPHELYPVLLVSSSVITIYAGPWIGIVLTVANALAYDYWYIEPLGIILVSAADYVRLSVFAAASGVISLMVMVIERQYVTAEEERVKCNAARRSREKILAFVSHDLKTPLSAIIMNCNLLQKELSKVPVPERTSRHLDSIARAAEEMTRLTSGLLDASGFESGLFRMQKTECRPADLISAVERIFDPLLHEKSLKFQVDVDPMVRLVRCDRDRIVQALSNFVGNAIKFSPRGATIAVRVVKDKGFVQFAVTDCGPGVSREDCAHLFEQYWTGESPSAGTGLGLFIVKAIAEAHGGRAGASSKPGQGSTFYFTLPTAEDLRPAEQISKAA